MNRPRRGRPRGPCRQEAPLRVRTPRHCSPAGAARHVFLRRERRKPGSADPEEAGLLLGLGVFGAAPAGQRDRALSLWLDMGPPEERPHLPAFQQKLGACSLVVDLQAVDWPISGDPTASGDDVTATETFPPWVSTRGTSDCYEVGPAGRARGGTDRRRPGLKALGGRGTHGRRPGL
ncbi:hypothetical protein R6Z07F_015964 [Ovis aries]